MNAGVYIFLIDPPQKKKKNYDQITCWGKKMIEMEKGGKNAYFFPIGKAPPQYN